MSFRDMLRDSLMEDAKEDLKTRLFGNGFPKHMFNHLYDNALPHATKKIADMEWLANQHMRGGIGGQDLPDVTTIQHKLTEFHKPVIKAKLQKKNLNQYKDWDEFNSAIEPHVGTAPSKNEMKNDTKVLLQNNTHIVRQHGSQESMEAAAQLPKENPYHEKLNGKANWCVSVGGTSGRDHFNTYTENGEHKFFTIEHTANHPTDPHRKYAILADHNRDRASAEVKNEAQEGGFDFEKYIASPHNKDVMNTGAGKYLSHVSGHIGNNRFKTENTVRDMEYSVDEEGRKHGPFTSVTKHNPNNFIKGEYTHGKESGNWHERSEYNGTLQETFKTYRENGHRTELHTKNGKPVQEMNLNASDRKVGIQKEWHPNGQLRVVSERDSEGMNTGEYKSFHENGQLQSHHIYKPGTNVMSSSAKYDADGTKREETNDEKGTFSIYHPNGKLKVHGGTHPDGHFISTHFDDQGRRSKKELRPAGLNGVTTERTHYNVHNATKISHEKLDNNGNVLENHHYNTDGSVYASHINDVKKNTSKSISYHPNGKEKEVTHIKRDKNNMTTVKTVHKFDEEGNSIMESVFKSSMFRRMIER